jgi:hypothetical protein|tara:strand:- start:4811 stop:5569 length:759 start_codon:yes stop_codon:yes gene_type:complete
MKIIIEAKELSELIESVALKGRYFDGGESKNGMLSAHAYLVVSGNTLQIWNADNTTICGLNSALGNRLETGSAVVDIKKTVKYLKGFTGVVTVEANDFLYISNDSSNATLPLVVEHSHQPMIDMLVEFEKTVRDVNVTFPTFRKTTFETKLHVSSHALSEATKGCDVINTARYKFDYNNDIFTMSSIKTDLDKYETTIQPMTRDGEPSTVEFTGFFHGFFKTVVNIYLKDDSPILFVSPTRILLKAPYMDRS